MKIHQINAVIEITRHIRDKAVQKHTPLSGDMALYDASFWSPGQAAFLRDALEPDSD